MSVIRLRDVSKRFDGRQVLRQVFFRLEDGARVGLVGNNGTGKTTVLRLILGREHPSEGRVEVDDGLRLGYFSQFSELSGAVCIEDVLRDLFAHIETTESQLRQTEEALSGGPEGAELARLLKDYGLHLASDEGVTTILYLYFWRESAINLAWPMNAHMPSTTTVTNGIATTTKRSRGCGRWRRARHVNGIRCSVSTIGCNVSTIGCDVRTIG